MGAAITTGVVRASAVAVRMNFLEWIQMYFLSKCNISYPVQHNGSLLTLLRNFDLSRDFGRDVVLIHLYSCNLYILLLL